MKKYIVAAFLAVLTAIMIAFPPSVEPAQKISVPVTVYQGDTLSSICIDLAEKYGDSRDWREIVYYAKEQNNIDKYIQPGDKLIIELVVENEKSR